MARISSESIIEGLTFDDVLLIPGYSIANARGVIAFGRRRSQVEAQARAALVARLAL